MPQPSVTTVLRRDVVGPLTLATRREARLRSEHARLYPGLVPEVWESAAMLADRVLAGGLLRGAAIGWRRRILHDAHFEFRGGEPESRAR
ncbi:MAG TPA: hypothetical protein VFI77_01380, partial [Gemmatimonadales bacterium]|nr:hypothetical protein [Gemmatimonadales bacterium]